MKIITATLTDLPTLARLFDSYRVFYEQSSNIQAANSFLQQRIENNESVIFLAVDKLNQGLGFTQLYPTFSSVSMTRRWILNDLFVAKEARQVGVASALMQTAEEFAKENGASGLTLSTAKDNFQAQALYEKRDWMRVEKFYNYNKSVLDL